MSLFLPLNRAWSFRRLLAAAGERDGWQQVDLPHSPFTPAIDGHDHWFGECEYRRSLQVPPGAPTAACLLYLGAAMHTAVVSIDGNDVARHSGGYLPFEVDLTRMLRDGAPHELRVRLDNRNHPDVPPGKPHEDLDFCWYGGLYRSVELRCHPAVYLTDPVGANTTASGGVFIRTLTATAASATLRVAAHLRNATPTPRTLRLEVVVLDGANQVARGELADVAIAGEATAARGIDVELASPRLWSPACPALYDVRITLFDEQGPMDTRTVRFGVRRVAITRSGGLVINGERLRPRGTNRHQEYPLAGYALPSAAQRRDAQRIKDAGFDYVRLSHYPQAPEFLDACDELGILVMAAIPGWQFMGGARFREACYQNARDLIRRDRNHPSVILWELSLNETPMDEAFMRRLHEIGHEEYPGDQMFTAGWIDRYDVFIHSRQHGEIHRWQNGDKALVIAEYGDWEFYAANEGFDQKTGAGVFASWSNARQRRGHGERGMRQQALNHLIALNDTLSSSAVLDGLWSMFDYRRGYDPVRAACGVMDIFRLPKFSYYFFRSQRDPDERIADRPVGPVILIGSHWTAQSHLTVPVYSNCDQVELRLNGVSIGRQSVSRTAFTQHLPHPPFVFQLDHFAPGTLEATGYIHGEACARCAVSNPGGPAVLGAWVDDVGTAAPEPEPDLVFVHAALRDTDGVCCVEAECTVEFAVEGGAELLGSARVPSEAGIASAVVRVPAGVAGFTLHAHSGPYTATPVRWERRPLAPAQSQEDPGRAVA